VRHGRYDARMIRDDILLRQIEQLARLVAALLRGEASQDEVEQELQATTGMPLNVLDVLPAAMIVPPIDDARVRRAKALAIADALEALGRTDKAAAVRALVS